uniref:Uncharacterized protein n=1 Tax=Timema tahoe TaxID=61484 RepID=A0A7R9IE67_9NEOP|nr:unnamed protein product [Timema tahoe]
MSIARVLIGRRGSLTTTAKCISCHKTPFTLLAMSYVRRHYSMGGCVRASKTTFVTSRLSEQGFGTSVAPSRVDDVIPKPLDKRIVGHSPKNHRTDFQYQGAGPVDKVFLPHPLVLFGRLVGQDSSDPVWNNHTLSEILSNPKNMAKINIQIFSSKHSPIC